MIPARFRPGLWHCQLLAVVVGLAALALWPVEGRATLLVPVLPGSGARLAAFAVDQGAAIVGRGAVPGSIVVQGPEGLTLSMLAKGIVPVRSADKGCDTAA